MSGVSEQLGSTSSWSVFRRKPIWVLNEEEDSQLLKRTFGFWSLLAVGVGGTVGSGIFVLSGAIARDNAGPASIIAWILAGFACLLTALSYCELATRIPATGSTYSFSYHSIGEIVGVIAAWLLFLEYGLSSSAVARAWGDKIAFWLAANNVTDCTETSCWVNSINGSTVNIGAFFIQSICVCILLLKVDMGKTVVNVLVMIKLLVVAFVIITGFFYFDSSNLTPFIPPQVTEQVNGVTTTAYGGAGIAQGTALAFFGYIGFDEVTCLTNEAVKPKRDVPMSIIFTVVIVTVLYCIASLVLVGMMPYTEINPSDGFYSAFNYVGATWAADIVIVSEVFVILPTVVLISLIPQTRLQYALSKDGMLPSLFSAVNTKGVLFQGTLVGGIVCVLISTFVPFSVLNDLISAGILLAFILSNTSLLLLRADLRINSFSEEQLDGLSWVYGFRPIVWIGSHVACVAGFGFSITRTNSIILWIVFAILAAVTFIFVYFLYFFRFKTPDSEDFFHVPCMPFIPAISILINWYLFAEIGRTGDLGVLALLAIAVLSYFGYGYRKSVGRHSQEWDPVTYRKMFAVESCSSIGDQEKQDKEHETNPQEESAIAYV